MGIDVIHVGLFSDIHKVCPYKRTRGMSLQFDVDFAFIENVAEKKVE